MTESLTASSVSRVSLPQSDVVGLSPRFVLTSKAWARVALSAMQNLGQAAQYPRRP